MTIFVHKIICMKRFFTFLLLLCSLGVAAQSGKNGRIYMTGIVTDIETKQPIPHVKLYITILAGQHSFLTETDDSGKYIMDLMFMLEEGDYPIKIEKEGYYPVNGYIKLENFTFREIKMKKIPQPANVVATTPPITPPPAEIKAESLEGFATNNLIFLIDVSSSMNQPDKLPLLKQAIKYLVGLYRPTDRISVITYSTEPKVVIPPVVAAEKNTIFAKIDSIKAGGISQGGNALEEAYRQALNGFVSDGNNRIILATDGLFTSGDKEEARMVKTIQKGNDQKVTLSVFSFGLVPPKVKTRLEAMARYGNGNYANIVAIDTAKEHLLMEAQAVK